MNAKKKKTKQNQTVIFQMLQFKTVVTYLIKTYDLMWMRAVFALIFAMEK